MPAVNAARRLMGSFKNLGLTPTQVRRLMPEWWDDGAAEDEGGLLELQILLARRFNVAIESLQADTPSPAFRQTTQRFKTVHPEGSSQLAVAASIGHGLAQLLASASTGSVPAASMSAHSVRSHLLQEQKAVTLAGLCNWLWKNGLPVIHITGWPDGLRRPDAMCVRVGERPVMMIVRKEQAPAKLTYLVAHEVGHVMSGHLRSEQNAVLVDDTLPVDNQQSFLDADEREADEFAMEVLGGPELHSVCSKLIGPVYTELTLAVAALNACKTHALDAGQVILGWGRLTQDWKLTNLALRYLMTTAAAPAVINDAAKKHIEASEMSSDGRDHLARLTGMEFAA